MIVTDTETYPGLVCRYSDRGVYIVDESGAMYSEAVNLPTSEVKYSETDVPVEY